MEKLFFYKMKRLLIYIVSTAFFLTLLNSCKKSEFLNTKPDQSLVVPQTLKDFQALLDNDLWMNGVGNSGYPRLGEIGADNYYLLDADYNFMAPLFRNSVIWAKQVYSNEEILDWDIPYKVIFYSNVVIDGLSKLKIANDQQSAWNNTYGSALFFRAHAFYQLSQVFAPAFDKNSANRDLGIPMRLSSDINEKISRSSVEQTYDQIIQDLKSSVSLLPDLPLYKTRPSKAAAYALLSRVYLSMSSYDNALAYADSSLKLQNTLLDYITINPSLRPFMRFNNEVIFTCSLLSVGITPVSIGRIVVDSNLYKSYEPNDLRKNIFFRLVRGVRTFVGTYEEDLHLFGGLAVDELYLNRAECHARMGNKTSALNDLNTLLSKRYDATFIPVSAIDANDALAKVLAERRKELIFRGIRWTDLRRLNKESRFANTLTRVVNGQTFSLPPNDPRYTYPIPNNVISLNPGMPQNER